MFKSLTTQWVAQKAKQAVSRRMIEPWTLDPKERKVLFVLPGEMAENRAFWQFIGKLQIRPSGLQFVVITPTVVFIPPAYISRSFLLKPEDLTTLGMPKREILDRTWRGKPEMAIDLHTRFNPVSALLVGASSAKFRIGPLSEESDPYYDLMLEYDAHSVVDHETLALLEKRLRVLEPRPLVFKPTYALI